MNITRSTLLLPAIYLLCNLLTPLHAQDEGKFEAFVFVSFASDTFTNGYYSKDKSWILKDDKGVAVAIYGVPKRKELVDIIKKYAGKPASLLNLQSIRYELTMFYHKNDRVLPYIYVPRQMMRNGVVQFVIEQPTPNNRPTPTISKTKSKAELPPKKRIPSTTPPNYSIPIPKIKNNKTPAKPYKSHGIIPREI